MKKMSAIPGVILDLTAEDEDDGEQWDLDNPDKIQKVCLLYTSDAADE